MKKIKVLLADPRHETVGTHSYFIPIGISKFFEFHKEALRSVIT